jgi:hypothetical protein
MRKFSIVVLAIFLTGCATSQYAQFYGVKVDQEWDDDAFYPNPLVTAAQTTNQGKSVHSNVKAWADVNGAQVVIRLKNESGFPIVTDYFYDKCIAVTPDGTKFELGKENQVSYRYHAPETIESGKQAMFYLQKPVALQSDNIAKIICKLGLLQGARMVLKPSQL